MNHFVEKLIHDRRADATLILQNILDHMPSAVVVSSDDLFVANDKFYDMIDRREPFVSMNDYLENKSEDYIKYDSFKQLLTTSNTFSRMYPIVSISGREVYVENSTTLFESENSGQVFITTLTDHTAMNDLSIEFEENSDRSRILEELMEEEYVLEYDLDKDILHFSERWKPDGVNTQYPMAKKWIELHDIIHPEEALFVLDAMNTTRAFKEERTLEFRARFMKEEYSWYRATYKLARSKHTGTLRAVGKICNIDKERLLHPDQAREGIDAKTGLFQPNYMESFVDRILDDDDQDNLYAFMLLQIDGFSEMKKTTGDLFSGRVESDVAGVLKNSFRKTDVLGYSGEGAFMVFLRKVPENIITFRAKKVLESVHDMMVEAEQRIPISCSIGISVAPVDGANYMELFLRADSAMYLSKARGGDTFSYFNTDIDKRQRIAPGE